MMVPKELHNSKSIISFGIIVAIIVILIANKAGAINSTFGAVLLTIVIIPALGWMIYSEYKESHSWKAVIKYIVFLIIFGLAVTGRLF